jgi:endonuclease YncB( thermonuclease family)
LKQKAPAVSDRRWIPAFAGMTMCLALLSPSLAQETVAPPVRDVTPPGVTPGPSGEGPLVREVPPPKPPEPPRWRRFFLPATTDAATFVIDGKLTIRVSGVTPPSVGDVCAFADGAPWPCGRTALHALRMFLRGRAVECYFPALGEAVEVIAPCRVGEVDLGHWLLESGWARANDLSTDDYLSASAAARCANLGIWQGAERPDYCPEPVAVDVGPEPPSGAASPEPASPWLPD